MVFVLDICGLFGFADFMDFEIHKTADFEVNWFCFAKQNETLNTAQLDKLGKRFITNPEKYANEYYKNRIGKIYNTKSGKNF